ncbi:hypothetical protein GCM10010987_45880 [Bradyrhizobium guangdongense]|uniref:Uncharacterized protein n=1 Tax=Bradyrhizobium guangdongense TaxID=1325090 RepID=A0AA87W6B9_9BRAD|nr:hypothetical protein GCM10010987_45880 [Bradyrhizobium guangdongense]
MANIFVGPRKCAWGQRRGRSSNQAVKVRCAHVKMRQALDFRTETDSIGAGDPKNKQSGCKLVSRLQETSR